MKQHKLNLHLHGAGGPHTKQTRNTEEKSTVANASRKIKQQQHGEINTEWGAGKELTSGSFQKLSCGQLGEEHSRQRERQCKGTEVECAWCQEPVWQKPVTRREKERTPERQRGHVAREGLRATFTQGLKLWGGCGFDSKWGAGQLSEGGCAKERQDLMTTQMQGGQGTGRGGGNGGSGGAAAQVHRRDVGGSDR